MAVILYSVSTAALFVLLGKVGSLLVAERRSVPWLAIAGVAALFGGLVLQAVWGGAEAALAHDPARSGWWRPFTSVLLQNGGPFGDVFNVVTAAIALALAQWHWGVRRALVLVVAAVLVPDVLDLMVGGGDLGGQARNYVGSSGVVYFLAATPAGALLLAGPGVRRRLLASAVPVAGLALWFLQSNGHGLVSAEGFVVGVLAALVSSRVSGGAGRRAGVRACVARGPRARWRRARARR
ncbi:hypothetical protein [Cryptosporangium arvum]|uniref:Uncharacterized protein n=1 Tax=Cryptosporangium arvum DSM 44712 TaxID=927661 RepID=A0A010ZVX2_9ACTN|nr:hypothetical protein [Cryptosporangium arvum]EXG82814.1 hypothetical protein CryarDRAFT_4015 [Cryptosporangium arvum DSM 44712]